jgi:anti-sigma regulatory factor (Ser/Thr protein kinase)
LPEHLTLQSPANPEAIAELRHRVTAFATAIGADAAVRDAVRLAVSEAVTNVVVHAYPDGQSGDVTLEAWRADGDLTVLISDAGQGLGPRSGRRGMGFGLGLMAQMADGFVISSRNGSAGTVVSLRFALA